MKIGIAKIIRRHLLNCTPSTNLAMDKANKAEIEDAKLWCRESIRMRVDQDSLCADLSKIRFRTTEIWENDIPKYRVTATLSL